MSQRNVLSDFVGAKIALLCEGLVITSLRDDIPTIPYPNRWDLPGGGREGDETPFECAQRETMEELGILISPESVVWERAYPSMVDPDQQSVFLVASISPSQIAQIVLGDEGQEWKQMPVDRWLLDEGVIPALRAHLRDYWTQK